MNREGLHALRAPLTLAGVALVAVLLAAAVLAPWLAPHDPRALVGGALERPSRAYLLGTNGLGQDVASRIMWGARRSLAIGVTAAAGAVLIGVAVGVVAGLLGGWADRVAMRVVDMFLAVPRLPLMILVAALVGATGASVTLLIALLFWPAATRLVRSQTLTLRQRGFVGAARGFGGGVTYLVRRHLAPGIAPIIVALFVAFVGNAVMLEATLAFLGLADAAAVSWGLDLNRALAQSGLYFTPAWTWLVLPPGFALTLAVLGFAFLGAGLEPALAPRSARP